MLHSRERSRPPPSRMHTLMNTRDLDACPACGGRALQSLPIEYDYQAIRWPAVECDSCHLRFLARQPTREGFVELYDSDYFQSDYHCGCDERSYFANEESFVKLAREQLGWIEKETRPGRILEVGCAGGYFLEAARTRGWQPVGIEISEVAATFARQKLGLDGRTGTIDTVELEAGTFEAAFLGDVLEHVPDPVDTLRAVHRLLKPRGILLVDGPTALNSLSWRIRLPAYRLLGRKRRLSLPPYHVLELTPATMLRLISKSRFEP